MTDFLKTADAARRFLAGFKAIDELASAFEQAGSLEQAGVEAQARLTKLRVQVERAESERADAVIKAENIVTDAKAKAKKLDDAASERQAAADKKAATAIAEAAEKADGIVAEAEASRDAALDAAGVADAACKAARAELKDLEARADKARAYIAKLKE